jgi:L-lactate dehydrogenase (cytochrome)
VRCRVCSAAAAAGIIYMAPTLASCSLQEILAARRPDQVLFFQLYVNKDRAVVERMVRQAFEGGCRALCVTVDAPLLGRREKDMRHKLGTTASVQQGSSVNRSQVAPSLTRAVALLIVVVVVS